MATYYSNGNPVDSSTLWGDPVIGGKLNSLSGYQLGANKVDVADLQRWFDNSAYAYQNPNENQYYKPYQYNDWDTGMSFGPIVGDGRGNNGIIGFHAFEGADAAYSGNPELLNGRPVSAYDAQGNLVNQGTMTGYEQSGPYSDFNKSLAVAIGGPLFGMGLQALGATGAAAEGVGAAGATGATTSPVLGSTGALSSTELGTLGASGAGGVGAAGGAGGGAAGGMAGFEGASSLPAHELTHAGGEIGGMSGSSGGFMDFFNGNKDWLGAAASLAGGLLGSKGQQGSSTTTQQLDPRMDSAVFGSLVPATQATLAGTIPGAQQVGAQLTSVGSGLLGQTAPNTPTNPYVAGILDDLQRRNQSMLDTSFNSIRNNAVAAGGLGDTRQGVAQGTAIARNADNFTGQAANLMGGLYSQDQNRLLQQQTLGAGLLAQGQQTPWAPLNNAAGVYSAFKPGSTTTTSSQGGGAMGALGGALGAAQFAKNMFGNTNNSSGGWWG